MGSAPPGAAQLALHLPRALCELDGIAISFEHEAAIRVNQPQLEAVASRIAPNLVQNPIR